MVFGWVGWKGCSLVVTKASQSADCLAVWKVDKMDTRMADMLDLLMAAGRDV